MNVRLLLSTGLVVLLNSGLCAAADTRADAACAGLAKLKVTDVVIESATEVPAGSVIHNEMPPIDTAPQPAHCLVRGEVGHHQGADGHAYGNKFELRLPQNWSGRFLFQGGGGLDGIIRPAVGVVVPDPRANIPTALERGYAVVSTDAGHDQATLKSPGDFGADPKALEDYEFNSTRAVAGVATALLKSYYGSASKHTYFMGCSEGGREGLIAAQRYPEVFDGIIAGSPAFRLTRAMVAEAWNTQTLAALAPPGNAGPPRLHQALTDHDLQVLSAAVLRQCDALDGARDGIIGDPLACHFDPQTLSCATAPGAECLAPEKVAAIRRIFEGPTSPAGESLYSNWLYDSGVSEFGWRLWMLGSEQMPALNLLIAPAAINGLALGNKPPPIDMLRMNFAGDVQRIDEIGPRLNATATDYTGFRGRQGKLLLYIGVSDPIFSAADLIRYYAGIPHAADFSRLYLVPGMNHCGGGKATDQFDSLAAMQTWVEEGHAPQRIVARGAAFPGRSRPLCPYPAVARYSNGDIEAEKSFSCK